MSYTKLFSHIITSSVWSEDDHTRILWITMLALSDKHGEVMAAVPGLAKVASLSIEATRKGIERLEAPDPDSRTPDMEGRRIEKIEGGWHIINHAKHRRMASSDEEKEKNAARQRRWYNRHKKPNAEPNAHNASVTHSNGIVTVRTDNADTKADTDTEKRASEEKGDARGKGKKPSASPKGPALADDVFIAELKRHNPDINVDRELQKMRTFLLKPQCKGRKMTRSFVVNWLTRCEVPFRGNGHKESGSGQWADSNKRKVLTPEEEERRSIEAIKRMMS